MADYPDWTESIELLGSEIQLPIDIQGAYIQLPVDIQGQYIDVAVDIVAQSVGNIAIDIAAQSLGNIAIDIAAQSVGNLNVNIAASTATLSVAIQSSAVTLNVNIASSSATLNVAIQSSAVTLNVNLQSQSANINIDIEAQSVAVKSQGEWSPQVGQQKYMTGYRSLPSGSADYIDYVVSSGKNLFITHLSFSSTAVYLTADGNKQQHTHLHFINLSTGETLAVLGGNGGGAITFPTPIRVGSNQLIRLYFENCSDHQSEIYVCWGGYEI